VTDGNGRTPEERERARLEREARRAGRTPPPAPPPAEPAPPPETPEPQPGPVTDPPVPSQPQPRRQHPAALEAARSALASRRAAAAEAGPDGDEPPPARSRLMLFAGLGGIVAVILILILMLFQPGKGPGGAEVSVTIPEGASVGQIADLLADQGVISGPFLFQVRATIDGSRGSLKPGTYALREDMSYGDALAELTKPVVLPEDKAPVTVVIPEGKSRREIAPIAAESGLKGDYVDETKSFKGFNPKKYGAKDPPDLEGFLFPATYELKSGDPVGDLIGQQLAAFQDNISTVNMKDAKKVNLTPYDVLIIASMVEREATLSKERPLIASVIYNRLKDGIPLGIDATSRFETNNWTEPLTQSTLEANTPYNTRLNAGLPPGPIGNPGLDSIEAAARPAKTDYLFFVVKPGVCGEHAFSETDAQFQEDQERYNSARAAKGGQSPSEC
jgi:uncharacterized YceG family protein